MIKKAFTIVCDKVFAELEPQGFKKNKVNNSDSNEMVTLFTGENVAYSVTYYVDKMHMVMQQLKKMEYGEVLMQVGKKY